MTRKLGMVLLLVAALAPRPAAALETDELLALVAMPLAVAAVADVPDVSATELMNFVALLNQADVPPTQFVEVVRYVPVALDDQTFVEYVRTRQQSGLSGPTLVTIIEDRYRTRYGLGDIDFRAEPARWVDTAEIVPAVVRNHPHGGPPGQLKKERGLETGAEVVHDVTRDEPARVTRKPAKPSKIEHHIEKHERREHKAEKDHGKGHGKGGGKKGKG